MKCDLLRLEIFFWKKLSLREKKENNFEKSNQQKLNGKWPQNHIGTAGECIDCNCK